MRLDGMDRTYRASWVGKVLQKGPHWIALKSNERLMGNEREVDSNEQTKECVELIPRVLRVSGSKKPTSVSQVLQVETTNADNKIKYDRNESEICEGSALCIEASSARRTCRKQKLVVILVCNHPQKNCKTKGR